MMRFPHFMKKMLDYWREFKILMGIDSKINLKNKILWNNRKILVGKKPVFIEIGMTPALPRKATN